MVPYLEPAGFIGLCGNGLTTSKIDDFFKQTAQLSPPILIRQSGACYVKYAASHGASFGDLQCFISPTLSGGAITSFSDQKSLYFHSHLLCFQDIRHWRQPKDAPFKAVYFTYEA
jgi:hypothetical protein